MMVPQQPTTPDWQMSQAFPQAGVGGCATGACGMGVCLCGVGAMDIFASPALATIRAARARRYLPAVQGVGQYGGAALGVGALVFMVAMTAAVGALSYQAGKAMTPAGSKKKTWGWVGVPVGLFTGPIGLGVMGWISNKR